MADLYSAIQPHMDMWWSHAAADALLHTPRTESEAFEQQSSETEGDAFEQQSWLHSSETEAEASSSDRLAEDGWSAAEHEKMGEHAQWKWGSENGRKGSQQWETATGAETAPGSEVTDIVQAAHGADTDHAVRLAIVGLPNVVGRTVLYLCFVCVYTQQCLINVTCK